MSNVFKGFKDVTIEVEDGMVTLNQIKNYRTQSVSIPVELWGMFSNEVKRRLIPDSETTVDREST